MDTVPVWLWIVAAIGFASPIVAVFFVHILPRIHGNGGGAGVISPRTIEAIKTKAISDHVVNAVTVYSKAEVAKMFSPSDPPPTPPKS